MLKSENLFAFYPFSILFTIISRRAAAAYRLTPDVRFVPPALKSSEFHLVNLNFGKIKSNKYAQVFDDGRVVRRTPPEPKIKKVFRSGRTRLLGFSPDYIFPAKCPVLRPSISFRFCSNQPVSRESPAKPICTSLDTSLADNRNAGKTATTKGFSARFFPVKKRRTRRASQPSEKGRNKTSRLRDWQANTRCRVRATR